MSGAQYDPDPHAHPGLHAIAIIEAVKAGSALIAASGLELLGPAPLQRWLQALIERFHFDLDRGAPASLLRAIDSESVHLAAAAVGVYGLIHLIEAWGIWRTKAWASWLGCAAAAVYVPFEVDALLRHPGWASALVLGINLLVVWVLARDLYKRRRR